MFNTFNWRTKLNDRSRSFSYKLIIIILQIEDFLPDSKGYKTFIDPEYP